MNEEKDKDGALTQDEIEKLLSGTSDIDFEPTDASESIQTDGGVSIETEAETTILANVISQAIYYQTRIFDKNYGVAVTHSNVRAGIKDGNRIIKEIEGKKFVQTSMNYSQGLKGLNIIIINVGDILKLVEIISGHKELDLNENILEIYTGLIISLFKESNGYFSRRFQRSISTVDPQNEIADSVERLRIATGSQTVHISYNLNPEGMAPIRVHQIIDVPLAKELINLSKSSRDAGDSKIGVATEKDKKKSVVTIRPVQYSNLEEIANIVSHGNIGLLLDIDMNVSVELGRTKDQIREVLNYSEGTIIELEKQAGEPVDILVNDYLIAKGEVMVMDELFGVRITQILSTDERLETLF